MRNDYDALIRQDLSMQCSHDFVIHRLHLSLIHSNIPELLVPAAERVITRRVTITRSSEFAAVTVVELGGGHIRLLDSDVDRSAVLGNSRENKQLSTPRVLRRAKSEEGAVVGPMSEDMVTLLCTVAVVEVVLEDVPQVSIVVNLWLVGVFGGSGCCVADEVAVILVLE